MKVPNFTEKEVDLIQQSLNNYFRFSNDIVNKRNVGDLEKEQYTNIRDNCRKLMKKIDLLC